MQAWFVKWSPLIGIALLSGVFNLIIAYTKFDRDTRSPFFTPWKSFAFWLWVFFQLAIPAAIFWLIYGSTVIETVTVNGVVEIIPRAITIDIVTKAITVGIGFTAFVNANIDLGFTGLPLDKAYFALTFLTDQMIAAKQTQKLAAFTTDLAVQLTQSKRQLTDGLTYLRNYVQQDFALKRNPIEQQETLNLLTQANSDPQAIASFIVGKVRSRDIFETLKRFGCQESFLTSYFPKQTKKQKQIP